MNKVKTVLPCHNEQDLRLFDIYEKFEISFAKQTLIY